MPQSTRHNLPSALVFLDHVRTYIKAELSFTAFAGLFQKNPLHQHLIYSPLQTVPKRGSTTRHVVRDLSYPPSFSVNSGIPSSTYLDNPFKLRLPGIDRLCEFVLSKGRGCYINFSKKISNSSLSPIPNRSQRLSRLGFNFDNQFCFDTRRPFSLRT